MIDMKTVKVSMVFSAISEKLLEIPAFSGVIRYPIRLIYWADFRILNVVLSSHVSHTASWCTTVHMMNRRPGEWSPIFSNLHAYIVGSNVCAYVACATHC